MIARRLTVGGSASFAPLPSTFELVSDGGTILASKVGPCATYYNGKVYFTYNNPDDGESRIASFDAVHTVSTPVDLLTGGAEGHAQPSVIVRSSDHKLLTAGSLHDAGNLYIRPSTNAEDATAFPSATDIDSSVGGADYTYCSLVQLSGESGKIYLFYRDIATNGAAGPGRIAYSTSTDGGSTWSARTLLMEAVGSGQVLYFKVGSNWTDRIDILTTDNDRSTPASALYHLYYQGGSWHKSDGTVISATKPFGVSDTTLVKSNADGAIDPADVAVSSSGVPSGTFLVYKSGTTSNEIWTCRYRSGSWQNDTVDDSNGLPGGHRFNGAPACSEGVADTVWYGKKVGSVFQIFEAVTANDGATWTKTQLDTGTGDAILPATVHDGIPGARCLYVRNAATLEIWAIR